jgi:hypothetical protein
MIIEYLKFFSEVAAHIVLFGVLVGLGMALLFFAVGFIMWLVDRSKEEKTWK